MSLLKGMEGVFIPVTNPEASAKWYEEKLGFTPIYIQEEAAVMRIAPAAQTVVCLVRTPNHQPMKFPDNDFDVGKYYNFKPENIEEAYNALKERGVEVGPLAGDDDFNFFTFYDPDGNPLGVCR